METNVNPQWVKLVQSQHPEKLLPFARKMEEQTLAAIYDMDVDTYRTIKRQLSQQAEDAALVLLEDSAFAGKVDRLPIQAGQTVIAIGESTTDDLLSWFELLRHLVGLRRPHDGIRFINEGISGYTTAQVLGRMSGIAAREPDWILCMIGGNDAMRIGREPAKTQVSAEETAKNLAAIRRIAADRTNAGWVWLTPPTFNEERAAAYPYFQFGQLSWRNEDIARVGDIIRSLPDQVVDTQAEFAVPDAHLLLGPDGVHPTLAGHKAIVTRLVEVLAGGAAE
ncbi:SGNH/GDSL hydrolase family protein [Paenibacillus tyrfis]|uniref:SGNH/GDSL hydrolase family protein n=1 Tax=Paenibacillus tyrfis TaxID=1501230 RepID=UPI00209D802C|nr:GDSL-type esterase/lipase family protein [Paenibacillus tyrfis]MCP1308757.1 GDSL-type esterase/lipase family protein [Paenibacillus tyrfis]